MIIDVIKNEDLTTLILEGRIDTLTSAAVEETITQVTKEDNFKLDIDFNKVEYISSSGLRVLLKAAKESKTKNGQLRLCHLNSTVLQVLEITGFKDIFKIV